MEYEDLYRVILDDELGWEHLITAIIREEGMDPMDIDIIKITDKFASLIIRLNSIDFRFGGKFVYTAAILLKLKSDRIMDDLLERKKKVDAISAGSRYIRAIPVDINITARIPLIRNRKITLSELINTIKEAIRYTNKHPVKFNLKLKEIKIEQRITMILQRLADMFRMQEKISFSQLLSEKTRKEMIYTFLPLLFLSNMDKIELEQEEPFSEIYVKNKRID
ncbi:segregation/condensation protein A [Candidatus Parvarchaeota archaeon]|nr:segregation/condensation protein A [Candidatus Parvarchaeota archaeon]